MKKIFTIAFFCMIINIAGIYAQVTYSYTGKPRFQILTKRNNVVLGAINIELYPTIAPLHVRNFDSLVSTGFYDTTAFHRAIPGFVIQGGDPNTRHGSINTWGYGQPTQPTVNAEFSTIKHLRGSFSAARSNNINSATSQFFICVAATPNLNGAYSLYGKVTSGMNFADTVVLSPKMSGSYSTVPLQKVEMFITYIGSNDTVPNAPLLIQPANDSLEVDTTSSILLKWAPVTDALLYHLHVSTSPFFTDTVALVKTTGVNYILQNLKGFTAYYWRVQANNGGNYSAYSLIRRFATNWITTSIKNDQKEITGIHVFPNPGTGKFIFSSVEKGDKISIYNIEGKCIYELVSKDKNPMIDLEDKEKGVYLYKISNGKKTKSGKFIIQ